MSSSQSQITSRTQVLQAFCEFWEDLRKNFFLVTEAEMLTEQVWSEYRTYFWIFVLLYLSLGFPGTEPDSAQGSAARV